MDSIEITSPDAVVAVLPYVVGYRLGDSLVIAWTRDDLLVLTQRIDLPGTDLPGTDPTREDIDAAVLRAELVEPALRSRPDAATIVVTGTGPDEDWPGDDWPEDPDDPDDDWPDEDERREAARAGRPRPQHPRSSRRLPHRRLPHRALVEAVQEQIGAAGIEVLDAIHAAGGRWWSYRCEQDCCPPEGRVVDPEVELVLRARFALAGIAPLDSRAAVAAQYRPDPRAHRRIAPRLQAALAERDGLDDAARVAWRAAQLAGPCADIVRASDVDDDVVAELACALGDVEVRDDFVRRLVQLPALAPVVGALAHAVRATPPGHLAAVATCAGVAAWMHGDGTRASIALEAALADDADFTFAAIVHAAVVHGLPPWEWRESMAAHLAA